MKSFLKTDKLLHATASALLVVVLAAWLPLWAAVALTASAGLAKEIVWDKWLERGTPDWQDLVADLVGIVVGAFTAALQFIIPN